MNQPGENQIEQCNRATTKQRATKPNHHNSKAPQATTAIKHNLTPQPNRRTKTGSSKRLRNHHIRSCARSRRKLSALSYSEIKIDRIVPKRSPPCTTRHKIQLLQWPHNPNQPKYSAGSWFFFKTVSRSPLRKHNARGPCHVCRWTPQLTLVALKALCTDLPASVHAPVHLILIHSHWDHPQLGLFSHLAGLFSHLALISLNKRELIGNNDL